MTTHRTLKSVRMKRTLKDKVLERMPKAYARYVGLSLRFVIVAGHSGPEISGHYLRERDAWADTAKRSGLWTTKQTLKSLGVKWPSRTPEYYCWKDMKRRCFCKHTNTYKHYGGRGITVCGRWMIFENFLEDMGRRPDGMSLDRIDDNGNYDPGNCRWATQSQQVDNSRATKHITFGGETLSISAWARRLGIHHASLRYRLKRFPLERALAKDTR